MSVSTAKRLDEPRQVGSEPATLLTSQGTTWAGFPLAHIRSPAAGGDSGMHLDHYWLAIVVKGGCTTKLRAGAKETRLCFSPGAFAGYPPGCHWDAHSFEGSVEAISVSLDWSRLSGAVSMDQEFKPLLSAVHTASRDATIGQILRAMAIEIRTGCQSGPIYAEGMSIALAARLASVAARNGTRRGRYFRLPTRSVASLVELIDVSLDGELSVARLAREVALSPSHFAGCFVETFGCPVHQYVLSRRVRKAIELLDARSCSGAEIALMCGFASQGHFSTVFKKWVGVSPSEYAKRP
jgi:AraC-like DNA-binding protein